MALIPATILTGFLGAGKTTLLNRILKEPHGHRIAVIENEFGPENIDNAILVENSDEEIVEMNNGCICCSVRGDLIAALTGLAQRRERGEIAFDRVVIETTGLANPGPVAQTFFLDDEVALRYLLDAVVTVVDARHGMAQLDAQEEARRQVGFADRILLSKTDLASPEEVAALTARLVRMNPRAPISKTEFGSAPIDQILDIRGFNLNDKLVLDPAFLQQEAHEHGAHEHDHCCDDPSHDHHNHDHHRPAHADDIAAFAITSDRPFDVAKLDEFLGGLVQVYGPRMLRYKGVLWMKDADCKVVFQGVHQVMGTDIGAPWGEDEKRCSRIVFIGKDLPKDIFVRGLEQCLS